MRVGGIIMNNNTVTALDYSPAHPWYYFLGGIVLPPKRIKNLIDDSGRESYRAEEFERLNRKAEPQRSESLRLMKDKIKQDLARDISIYRTVVRELNIERGKRSVSSPFRMCDDVHTSMSLKYCHIYNDLLHLKYLENMASKQMDLFVL